METREVRIRIECRIKNGHARILYKLDNTRKPIKGQWQLFSEGSSTINTQKQFTLTPGLYTLKLKVKGLIFKKDYTLLTVWQNDRIIRQLEGGAIRNKKNIPVVVV